MSYNRYQKLSVRLDFTWQLYLTQEAARFFTRWIAANGVTHLILLTAAWLEFHSRAAVPSAWLSMLYIRSCSQLPLTACSKHIMAGVTSGFTHKGDRVQDSIHTYKFCSCLLH